MTIRKICEKYDMGQTALSRKFEIPLRTVQDWYAARSTPPAYVVNMIEKLLEMQEKEKDK